MRDVYIIGAGQVPVVKQAPTGAESLGAQSLKLAINDAGGIRPRALYVGNMLSGLLSHQTQLAAVIASRANLLGIEALGVEAACGSGAGAVRWGIMAIKSGMHEVVGVCGSEHMTAGDRDSITQALVTAADSQERSRMETFVSLNARLHQHYLERYGYSDDVFAPFALNAHERANKNPNALFHTKRVDAAHYQESRRVSGPLRILDAAPICDGSASILLASEAVAKRVQAEGRPTVRIVSSAAATDSVGLGARTDELRLEAVAVASSRAFETARMRPQDISIYEPHDAFNIMAVLSLEATGFAADGMGVSMGSTIGPTGTLPTSTMGGLKARGHPVGATGVYQMVEAHLQLTERAGDAQVPGGPSTALIQNFGGTGATVVTHILERS